MPPLRPTHPSSKILVVDDNEANLALLVRLLGMGGYFRLETASNGAQALHVCNSLEPDLIVLDLHMPGTDGYEVLRELRSRQGESGYLPILVFTADQTPAARERALALGASDFLVKPVDANEMLLRVENFLRARHMHLLLEDQNHDLEDRVSERTGELALSRLETLECLARASEFRDDQTGEHVARVGTVSAQIAKQLGLGDKIVELMRHAAPLHDIGKIGIPDAILLKPGKLEPAEFEVMKRHPIIGAKILSLGRSPVIKLAREIALYHHEKWDGSGYCHGLEGELIPLPARIVAVADAFDAMTHDRPYKVAIPVERAIERIKEASGSHFDPGVVQTFLECGLSAPAELDSAA